MGSRQDEQSRKRASVILQEAISGVVRKLGSKKANAQFALWQGKARNHTVNPRVAGQSVLLCAYKNTGEGSQVLLGTWVGNTGKTGGWYTSTTSRQRGFACGRAGAQGGLSKHPRPRIRPGRPKSLQSGTVYWLSR